MPEVTSSGAQLPDPPTRSLIDYVGVAARGFCMGAADVVPGVSGGTMAFVLGIYDELLSAIQSFNLVFFRRLLSFRWREAFAGIPWRFLLALGSGIGVAILALAESLKWALHHHPEFVWAFFFGLVLASVFVVRKHVKRWTASTVAFAVVAAIGAYVLVGLTPTQTPDTPWFLFLSGAIAICAMILPGISGAFILVLLGKYQYVLDAVVQRDLVPLAIVAAGCAVGLLIFVRLLRWLLRRFHDQTVAVLSGFMLGSLRKVWPWKDVQAVEGVEALSVEINILPAVFTAEIGFALGLLGLGVGLVLSIERLAARRATGRQ